MPAGAWGQGQAVDKSGPNGKEFGHGSCPTLFGTDPQRGMALVAAHDLGGAMALAVS
jgi:hypothetical protein